ncbi:MAG: baseplate J/gp47 family protein, partial [candidate division WWE3 bacterium]|nr:baseplate J/gp47 family protein [candidate division WWE3 bacterium]
MKHLFDLMQQIVAAEGGEVTIDIPEGNFNFLMLRVLRAKARRENRTVRFNATGPCSRRLISSLEEGREPEIEKREKGKEAVTTPAPRRKLRKLGLVLLLVVGVLLLLGAAAFAAIYYLPRAEVILTLSPIPLVKEVPVTADTAVQEVDGASGVVPGTLQTVEEIGQKTTPATGAATVGEKAKGTVKFTNGNVTPVDISAGTKIIETSKGLVFIVDSAVSVPASSATTTATVTAEKIGGGYNLEAGKLFSIEGKSGISAS